MEENKKYLPSPTNAFSRTRVAIHYSLYGIYGFAFKTFLFVLIQTLSLSGVHKVLCLFIIVLFEGLVLSFLYNKIKKDFFHIEQYKEKTEHPDTWVFRKMNEFHEKKKGFLSWGFGLSLLYIGCFIPIAIVAGPMLTTLLFRNCQPYSYKEVWNKESMTYFVPSCVLSALWKYMVFSGLTWTWNLF